MNGGRAPAPFGLFAEGEMAAPLARLKIERGDVVFAVAVPGLFGIAVVLGRVAMKPQRRNASACSAVAEGAGAPGSLRVPARTDPGVDRDGVLRGGGEEKWDEQGEQA